MISLGTIETHESRSRQIVNLFFPGENAFSTQVSDSSYTKFLWLMIYGWVVRYCMPLSIHMSEEFEQWSRKRLYSNKDWVVKLIHTHIVYFVSIALNCLSIVFRIKLYVDNNSYWNCLVLVVGSIFLLFCTYNTLLDV